MKKLLLALSLLAVPAIAPVVLPSPTLAAAPSALGDLSSFQTIATDTLKLVDAGDLAGAQKRITDFETAWDAAEPTLYALDKADWMVVDKAADGAISSLRKPKPDAAKAKVAVKKLIATIQTPSAKK
ncbi:hypothetical protein [Rhizobium sp. BK376]|uniref:hypothetical protein n=1 Tax=Rhizobium sp. BK376 TaxID=2512149 RepID=UPI0010D757BC|nr:hypothetical protein [Rhizobium sp. BK376]TCR85266.1 hypothetical protein EV561_10737 [Rhizobium sp. BK376]